MVGRLKCQKRMMKSKSFFRVAVTSATVPQGLSAPSFRSKPALKARPAPATTRTRMFSSRSTRSSWRLTSSIIDWLKAFRRSGRLNVSRPIGPRASNRIVS
jgi:hypothetical protein